MTFKIGDLYKNGDLILVTVNDLNLIIQISNINLSYFQPMNIFDLISFPIGNKTEVTPSINFIKSQTNSTDTNFRLIIPKQSPLLLVDIKIISSQIYYQFLFEEKTQWILYNANYNITKL